MADSILLHPDGKIICRAFPLVIEFPNIELVIHIPDFTESHRVIESEVQAVCVQGIIEFFPVPFT
jgi:hypothetical protein